MKRTALARLHRRPPGWSLADAVRQVAEALLVEGSGNGYLGEPAQAGGGQAVTGGAGEAGDNDAVEVDCAAGEFGDTGLAPPRERW